MYKRPIKLVSLALVLMIFALVYLPLLSKHFLSLMFLDHFNRGRDASIDMDFYLVFTNFVLLLLIFIAGFKLLNLKKSFIVFFNIAGLSYILSELYSFFTNSDSIFFIISPSSTKILSTLDSINNTNYLLFQNRQFFLLLWVFVYLGYNYYYYSTREQFDKTNALQILRKNNSQTVKSYKLTEFQNNQMTLVIKLISYSCIFIGFCVLVFYLLPAFIYYGVFPITILLTLIASLSIISGFLILRMKKIGIYIFNLISIMTMYYYLIETFSVFLLLLFFCTSINIYFYSISKQFN